MSGPVINADFVDAIALPRIVWLRPNLPGLVFPLMKLLPARFIVRKALEEGELRPGGLIAETTSGTFGLALGMAARLNGHPLTLVSDPAIEPPLRRRLEDLGATVHIVRETGPTGGFQPARLEVLERILADSPGSFRPRQYSNPHNPSPRGFGASRAEWVPSKDWLFVDSVAAIERLSFRGRRRAMPARAGCVCADRGISPPALVARGEQEPARAIRTGEQRPRSYGLNGRVREAGRSTSVGERIPRSALEILHMRRSHGRLPRNDSSARAGEVPRACLQRNLREAKDLP